MSKTADTSKINFIQAIGALLVFIFMVGVLVFGLQKQNSRRKAAIIEKYSQEMLAYIQDHRHDLVQLFNEVMPQKSQYCDSSVQLRESGVCKELSEKIYSLFPDTNSFQDYSSTFFVKSTSEVYGNSILIMTLSGNTSESSGNEELLSLLYESKETPILIYSYRGYSHSPFDNDHRYVVFPVQDDSGKTVGALLRNVIEK